VITARTNDTASFTYHRPDKLGDRPKSTYSQ
jgi:hypothetical protein